MNGDDEVPHSLLNLRMVVQTHEVMRYRRVQVCCSLTKVISTSTHSFNSGAMATKEVVGRGLGTLASCISLAYSDVASPGMTGEKPNRGYVWILLFSSGQAFKVF